MAKKKGFFAEFKAFIARGNVLDMAVGIIIGGAFTAIITAIVNGILTPLLQSIGVGADGFGALQIVLNEAAVTANPEVVPIILDFGIVISSIVTFLLTAFILFLIVWTTNRLHEHAEKFKKSKEEAPAPAPEPEPEPVPPAPTAEELLTEIRDLLKSKNE